MVKKTSLPKSIKQSVIKILSQAVQYNFKFPSQITDTVPTIGTGFFIDNKGHILTCAHVINSAKTIYIELENGKRYKCKVISFCPKYDLAILKTEKHKNKHHLKLSTTISVGDHVYCLGYPLNTSTLVITKGVVSAFTGTAIQTDSTINPGNSGGPLMLDNKVVGVNSAKIPPHIGENTGYAVPIKLFNVVKEELLDSKNKIVRRPMLGIGYNSLNETFTKMNKLKLTGVYINNVEKGAPIFSTGIKEGDVLLKINNNCIDNLGHVAKYKDSKINIFEYMDFIKKNSNITINFWSNGKIYNKKFIFNGYYDKILEVYPLYEKINYLILSDGLILTELNLNLLMIIPELIAKFQMYDFKNEQAVVIVNVIPNSEIYNLEIFSEGDIVKTINDKSVKTINDINKIIKNSTGIVKIKTDYNKTCYVELEKNNKVKNVKNTIIRLIS